MYVRSAYFVGKPFPGKEAEFRQRMQEAVKLYLGFKNIRAAQFMDARDADEGAPGIYATLQLCFDNESDLQAALATPFRQEMRSHFLNNVFPLFDGAAKHINHQVYFLTKETL